MTYHGRTYGAVLKKLFRKVWKYPKVGQTLKEGTDLRNYAESV